MIALAWLIVITFTLILIVGLLTDDTGCGGCLVVLLAFLAFLLAFCWAGITLLEHYG